MNKTTLSLLTRDNEKLTIDKRILEYSEFLRTTVEGIKSVRFNLNSSDLSGEAVEEDIPVDITCFILTKIREFFEHHDYKDIKAIKTPLRTSNFASIASEWDNNFFLSLTDDQISELVMVLVYNILNFWLN